MRGTHRRGGALACFVWVWLPCSTGGGMAMSGAREPMPFGTAATAAAAVTAACGLVRRRSLRSPPASSWTWQRFSILATTASGLLSRFATTKSLSTCSMMAPKFANSVHLSSALGLRECWFTTPLAPTSFGSTWPAQSWSSTPVGAPLVLDLSVFHTGNV